MLAKLKLRIVVVKGRRVVNTLVRDSGEEKKRKLQGSLILQNSSEDALNGAHSVYEF